MSTDKDKLDADQEQSFKMSQVQKILKKLDTLDDIKKDLGSVKGNLTKLTKRVGDLEQGVPPTPEQTAVSTFAQQAPDGSSREQLKEAFLTEVAKRASEAFDLLDEQQRILLGVQLDGLVGGLGFELPKREDLNRIANLEGEQLAGFLPALSMNQKARKRRLLLPWTWGRKS